MRRWLRLVVGPQPVLRLIALLLIVIAYLLYLIRQDLEATPNPCGGDYYTPCSVVIERS